MRRARFRSLLWLIALCGLHAFAAACDDDRLPRFARPPGGPADASSASDDDAGTALDR